MGRKKKKRAKKKARTMLPPPSKSAPAEAEASSLEDLATEVPNLEHRSSSRVALAVELHMASESHFFSGLSGDISEGGVFVSTYRSLEPGSQVDLEFSLPGRDSAVHVRGEVRWHRDASEDHPPGVGIAFDHLEDDDRRAIHAFCSARPPLYYDDVG